MGGLDENGKNLYVIDVDDDLFIFDCGLKYANSNLFGIDYDSRLFSGKDILSTSFGVAEYCNVNKGFNPPIASF